MGSFGAPGFVRLGWPAMTRQPFANAQTVSSSFVNADILSGLNEAQERDDRFPLPPCSDRACHSHVRCLAECHSDARATPAHPDLPPFCALCSANHFMTSESSLVLPSNSSTPTISSSLRRFTIVHAFLKFLGGAFRASTGHPATRIASRGDLPVCRAATGCRLFALSARKLPVRSRPGPDAAGGPPPPSPPEGEGARKAGRWREPAWRRRRAVRGAGRCLRCNVRPAARSR